MNAKQLYEEIGAVNDDLIAEAETAGRKKSFQKRWIGWGAVAACLTLMLSISIPMLRNDETGTDVLYAGNGITVRYIENLGNLPASKDSLVYYTEQELFTAWDTDIFRGKVVGIRNIEIDFGYDDSKCYWAIAEIRVDKIFRGTADTGDIISVLLKCPIGTNMKVEDNDVIENLRVGQTGIFMPLKNDETSIYSYNDKDLDLRDLAEYSFLDGSRYAFLKTNKSLIFAKWAYESIATATTLEEIERYIIEMVIARR